MAKKKGNVYGAVVLYEKTHKGTSIGRRPNTSSMNKNKRRSYKCGFSKDQVNEMEAREAKRSQPIC